MKRTTDIVMICLVLLVCTAGAVAAEKPKIATVMALYPDLTSGVLSYARLTDLPDGTLIKAKNVTIVAADVNAVIAQKSPMLHETMNKNAFVLLETLAEKQLFLHEARMNLGEPNSTQALTEEDAIIKTYVEKIVKSVKVTDAEAKKFFKENTNLMAGNKFAAMEARIKEYLLSQKKNELLKEHIRTIGKRVPIEISASWVKQKAISAKDNPVDKALTSGKPSLVDFGSERCQPCRMMAPILEKLKKKYDGKMNVVFIDTEKDPFISPRYVVDYIPVQVFFDKDGKQVFKHTGFMSELQLEAKIAEMGVK